MGFKIQQMISSVSSCKNLYTVDIAACFLTWEAEAPANLGSNHKKKVQLSQMKWASDKGRKVPFIPQEPRKAGGKTYNPDATTLGIELYLKMDFFSSAIHLYLVVMDFFSSAIHVYLVVMCARMMILQISASMLD